MGIAGVILWLIGVISIFTEAPDSKTESQISLSTKHNLES